jgi:diaminohydroxyphosphoribosylaminopyrimidine deaminase / 5-amino-6-(5-phosphoribosylamino)uracil reductase
MADGVGSEEDRRHMRRALELAGAGWGRVSPNPLVGAVVVRDGLVVGEGWHEEYGGEHAEVRALRAAGERARGATVYVTLEPCAHTGKTPPYTRALLDAGVERVVYACADPDKRARGGAAVLRAAGVQVTGGVEEDAARALNAAFLRAHDPGAPRRPWTELKLALSLDGRVADLAGRSNWITGASARAEVHRLRAACDAIAVGIGTALADDPQLTVRGSVQPRVPPVRVVFDRRLRLSCDSRLVNSARHTPVWVVCSPDSLGPAAAELEKHGVRILTAVDLRSGLEALREAGIRSLFCEGGARFASTLLDQALVDRLTLFYAPLFLGSEGGDPFRDLSSSPLDLAHRWTLRRIERFGADALVSLDR